MPLPLLDGFSLVAIVISFGLGLLALAANHRRPVNIVFFTISLHVSCWLAARSGAGPNALHMVRITTLIGATMPIHMWVLTEAIIGSELAICKLLGRAKWWLFATTVVCALTFSDSFLIESSPVINNRPQFFGSHFYVYSTLIVFLYVSLYIYARKKAALLIGIRKLELEIIIKSSSAVAAVVTVITIISVLTTSSTQIQPAIVVALYAIMAYSITSYRILNSRQLLLVIVERLTFVLLAVSFCALIIVLLYGKTVMISTAAVSIFGAVLAMSLTLYPKWQRSFKLVPDAAEIRRSINEVAKVETIQLRMENSFKSILQKWLSTRRVEIFWTNSLDQVGDNRELSHPQVLQTLRTLRWVTPERIARMRPSTDVASLLGAMSKLDIGLIVAVEGSQKCLIIAAGTCITGDPYTYPLANQLTEIAALIETYYDRSYYVVKAKQAEQIESVGLIGAHLAHEIRNPLVSVKTFIRLTERNEHFEFRSHFIPAIKDELTRIEKFTEQLLDLSRPREYKNDVFVVSEMAAEVIVLLEPEATDSGILLNCRCDDGSLEVIADKSALKQVLINLIRNAMQAVHNNTGPKWVQVAITGNNATVHIAISDSGPGIASDIRNRLFQPFQTDKPNGFGLGLAICKDILSHINGTIAADEPVAGLGATFRVSLTVHSPEAS